MTTSLFIAYAGMRADMHALDVAANNLANVNTNGFREQRAFVAALDAAGQTYPTVGGTREKPHPGPEVRTGRPLDVAIEGLGFLVVETPAGRRYTRDGGMNLTDEGLLVTREGHPLLGQGGRITLGNGEIEIDPEGRVSVDGVQEGRLLLVELDPDTSVRESGGLYRSLDGRETPAAGDRLKQGFLEKSNVDLPSGDVLQLMRHFQSLSRAMQLENGIERRLISTVRGQ